MHAQLPIHFRPSFMFIPLSVSAQRLRASRSLHAPLRKRRSLLRSARYLTTKKLSSAMRVSALPVLSISCRQRFASYSFVRYLSAAQLRVSIRKLCSQFRSSLRITSTSVRHQGSSLSTEILLFIALRRLRRSRVSTFVSLTTLSYSKSHSW